MFFISDLFLYEVALTVRSCVFVFVIVAVLRQHVTMLQAAQIKFLLFYCESVHIYIKAHGNVCRQ